MCNNKYDDDDDDDDDERWLAALSIGPGIFEIVCMLYIIFIMSVVYS